MELESARVSPRDRGFTLGDGIFETMRVRNHIVPWLGRHLQRLRSAAEVIGLPLPWTDRDLTKAVSETLRANSLQEGVARLTLSRGVPAARGLLPEVHSSPTLVIDAQPFPGYPLQLYATGMIAIASDIVRNERSPLSRIKSLGYLDNVLARRQAADRGADEAILWNTTGGLACATSANLFVVHGQYLITPDVTSGALPGITAGIVLDCLAEMCGLEPHRTRLEPHELLAADEAFLTSSLLGIMPLCVVDGHPIAAGVPGPVTGKLRHMLEAWTPST